MQRRNCRGKQMVHVAADRIVNRVHVSDATVMLNQQLSNVARRATDLVKQPSSLSCVFSLLVNRWLEVMEQIELFMVNDAGRKLIVDAIAIGISAIVGNRRSID